MVDARRPGRQRGRRGSLAGHGRLAAFRRVPWARQVLNLRPLACEASALPLSYAPGPGSLASALGPPARPRTWEKETAARARVAPPSIGRARSSDVRWALCTALSFRRKTQYGATSAGRRPSPRGPVGVAKGWAAHPRDGSPRRRAGSGCHDAHVEPGTHDASRRTYLAEERTLLAWWRSGLAAFAVSVGVGRLLPALLDEDGQGAFIALGVAYALLGLGLVLFGSLRERARRKRSRRVASPPFRARSSPRSPRTWHCSGSPRSPSSWPSERWLSSVSAANVRLMIGS